jgi:hypothetical protein
MATWAEYKLHPVVSAGLNKACSQIPEQYFNQTCMHTNAGKQTY